MSNFFDKLSPLLDSAKKNKGILGTAAAGGLLGAIFGGSKSVKKAAKSTVAIGAGAAAAALAYKLYQSWQNKNNTNNGSGILNNSSNSTDNLFDAFNQQSNAKALSNNNNAILILQALIFAARADGHIDKNEQDFILEASNNLNLQNDLNSYIKKFLQIPLDVQAIASQVHDHDQALEIYMLSAAAINVDNQAERQYMQALAKALNINSSEANMLDQKALEYKNNF